MISSNDIKALLFGVVVTAAWTVLTKKISDNPWANRFRDSFIRILAFLMLAVAVCAVIYFRLSVPPDELVGERLSFIFYLFVLVQLLLVFSLISVMMRTKEQQYRLPFKVERLIRPNAQSTPGPIDVRRLFQRYLRDTESLMLSWETYGDGLEFLEKQIRGHKPNFSPSAFFGINNTGASMAMHLSWRFVEDKAHLGFLKTSGDRHEVVKTESWIPDLEPEPRCILLVDSELKSGNSLRNAFDFLTDKYKTADIKIAVLVACPVKRKPRIAEMTDLKQDKNGQFAYDNQYLPDFLAFVSESSIESPEGVR